MHNNSVNIEQVCNSNLRSVATRVISLSDIDPKKSNDGALDCHGLNFIILDDRCSSYSEKDVVEFGTEDSFLLRLKSEISFGDYVEGTSFEIWRPLEMCGLNIVWDMCRKETPKGVKTHIFLQEYAFELDQDCEFGYVQFYCTAKSVRHCGRLYDERHLITIFVYRNGTCAEVTAFPAFLTVRPAPYPVYVPLHAEQGLQLLTPVDVKPETANDEVITLVNSEFKDLAKYGNICCHRFLVRKICRSLEQFIKLSVLKENRRIGIPSIVIPPLLQCKNGYYTIVDEPLDTCIVACHNISGFLLKATAAPGVEWVYNNDNMMVFPRETDAVVRFVRQASYISITKGKDYWRIVDCTDYLMRV